MIMPFSSFIVFPVECRPLSLMCSAFFHGGSLESMVLSVAALALLKSRRRLKYLKLISPELFPVLAALPAFLPRRLIDQCIFCNLAASKSGVSSFAKTRARSFPPLRFGDLLFRVVCVLFAQAFPRAIRSPFFKSICSFS